MQRGGRQLLDIVHEAAIAGDRHDRPVGPRHLGAERRRIAEAERPLIAAVQVGARAVDRKGEPADIADLGQILDIDAVVRQFGADGGEILALRPERFLEPRLRSRLQLIEFALAGWALRRDEGPV